MDSGIQNITYSVSVTVAVTSSETLAVYDFIAFQATWLLFFVLLIGAVSDCTHTLYI